MKLRFPMNYQEAVKIIEKLSVENKRLKRRVEELETHSKSTRRGRKSIINDEMIQKTQQLRDRGSSIRDIAFELGVSSYTAHKILHMNDSVSESGDSIT